MFEIYGGRIDFYQWDLNQKLIVNDTVCGAVHFCNGTSECALICEIYKEGNQRFVNVPNILLQTAAKLRVYAYGRDCTLYEMLYNVKPRKKPADYIYTETEYWTADKAVEKALQDAMDSGKFNGDSVKYTAQSLTEEQKAQARANIGALTGTATIKDGVFTVGLAAIENNILVIK